MPQKNLGEQPEQPELMTGREPTTPSENKEHYQAQSQGALTPPGLTSADLPTTDLASAAADAPHPDPDFVLVTPPTAASGGQDRQAQVVSADSDTRGTRAITVPPTSAATEATATAGAAALGATATDTKPTPAANAAPGPSRAERCFRALACLGPLALAFFLAAQIWPEFLHALQGNALYCPYEAQNILAFQASQHTGQWLAPLAMGQGHWPLFALFLALLSWLCTPLPWGLPLLYPVATASSALLTLLAVWALSRAAAFDARSALAAGLILLCTPLFAPLAAFVGPQALSAALTLFSLLFFLRGSLKSRAWFSMIAAFVLAALAGFSGGLFHLLLPPLTAFVFCLWSGRIRRAQSPDVLTGFTLMLLVLAAWVGWVTLSNIDPAYQASLRSQWLLWPWPPRPTWWQPLSVGFMALLPWAALVCCVGWKRVLASAPVDFRSVRVSGSAGAGAAFLWTALLLGGGLSLFAPDLAGAVLCLACLAAPLLGKALLRLPVFGSRLFYLFAALCLLHAGMALVAAGFGPSLDWLADFLSRSVSPEQRAQILGIKTLPWLGVLGIAAAVTLSRFTRRDQAGGALLVCTLLSVALAQPVAFFWASDFEAAPQAQLRRLSAIETNIQTASEPGSDALKPAAPEPDQATESSPEPLPLLPEPATPAGPGEPGSPEPLAPAGPAGPGAATPAAPAEPALASEAPAQTPAQAPAEPTEGAPATPAP